MALGTKLPRLGLSNPSGKKGLITAGPEGKRPAKWLSSGVLGERTTEVSDGQGSGGVRQGERRRTVLKWFGAARMFHAHKSRGMIPHLAVQTNRRLSPSP